MPRLSSEESLSQIAQHLNFRSFEHDEGLTPSCIPVWLPLHTKQLDVCLDHLFLRLF